MIASTVWSLLGDPAHYLEPFFGSGAVLLSRPAHQIGGSRSETVNDKDGHLANVWRAIKTAPDEVARHCDWPVNHADLVARRRLLWIERAGLIDRVMADDAWCDPRLAAMWIWVMCASIATSGIPKPTTDRGIPHLANSGRGIFSITERDRLPELFAGLAARLRRVRVTCGDWSCICGGDWQDSPWPTVGVFFDPPYSAEAGRTMKIYREDSGNVAHDVRAWCLERGSRKNYRIVLAGYKPEHDELLDHGWTAVDWKACGGYGSQSSKRGSENACRERLWCSPGCCAEVQETLFL